MSLRLIIPHLFAFGTLVAGCQMPQAAAPQSAGGLHVDDTLGFGIVLPAGWNIQTDQRGPIAAPTEPDSFATITAQGMAPGPLGASLEAAYEDPELSKVEWERIEPAHIASRPGLAYRVSFTYLEQRWRKVGVLVTTAGAHLDVTCAAPVGEFDSLIATCDHALGSIWLF